MKIGQMVEPGQLRDLPLGSIVEEHHPYGNKAIVTKDGLIFSHSKCLIRFGDCFSRYFIKFLPGVEPKTDPSLGSVGDTIPLKEARNYPVGSGFIIASGSQSFYYFTTPYGLVRAVSGDNISYHVNFDDSSPIKILAIGPQS